MTGSGLNGGNDVRLIPHHQDDSHGRREYRSPDGIWRVVRTRRPGGNRNERARWEVHERSEAHAPWHCHAAFERRRDAVVFLDTTAVTPMSVHWLAVRPRACGAPPPSWARRVSGPTGGSSPASHAETTRLKRMVGNGVRTERCGSSTTHLLAWVYGTVPAAVYSFMHNLRLG